MPNFTYERCARRSWLIGDADTGQVTHLPIGATEKQAKNEVARLQAQGTPANGTNSRLSTTEVEELLQRGASLDAHWVAGAETGEARLGEEGSSGFVVSLRETQSGAQIADGHGTTLADAYAGLTSRRLLQQQAPF